jgi:hypothetical protein
MLLFIRHFRTDPSYWGQYPDLDYVAAPVLLHEAGVLGGRGFMLVYPGASANMVAALYASRRLATWGWAARVRR